MIAAAVGWIAGTKLGRWCAIAGAVVMAVLTFGAWNRRKGRQDEHQRQAEADHAAVSKADQAARDYRSGGDVGDRLRRGEF